MRSQQNDHARAVIGLRVVYVINAVYPQSFPVGVDYALGILDLSSKDHEGYQRIMSGTGVALATLTFRKLLDQGLIEGVLDGNELLDASITPITHKMLSERGPDGRTKVESIDAALLRDMSGRFPVDGLCVALAREIGFEP